MTEQTEQKRSYKQTLNPRQTSFAMKANLVQREPQFQKRWDALSVYNRLRDRDAGKQRFLLHDGPPYANGDIHLGHLLNKCMKDFVVRSRSMMGFDVPFVPGWDCHGLPIEHKVMQERQAKGKDAAAAPADATDLSAERMSVRRDCRKYAEKYIKLQKKQMQRLGTIGDYDDPYLTMNPRYEAAVREVFAELVGKGLVYRDLKPVHWSIANETALADAELEYYDRDDTSVYVLFEVDNPADLPESLNARPGLPIALMIWTTTPWTLPANLAVAAAPQAEYGLYRFDVGDQHGAAILACDLAQKIADMADAQIDLLGSCSGAQLEAAAVRYRHPFIERTSPLVTADYVTLEDSGGGTGLVHTAPGHGVEDYQTGLRHKLDIYCPVLEDGTFDHTAPDWLQGVDVWKANALVTDHLRESQHLFHDHTFSHSYPHDWRSKTPVIFRATEQWFVRVDAEGNSLRDMALKATESGVRFIPEWGRNRMRGMLESRPDWCLSRQRAWGLPIPAFFGPEKGQVLLTRASVEAVSKLIRDRGSDAWFKAEPHDLLTHYDPTTDPDAPDWAKSAIDNRKITKSNDIFDVWFESGSSWAAVIQQRMGEDAVPVDLYLEGSDQHRGWFQLSLLPALGVIGVSPFKAVLTHGFIVDKFGQKYAKSRGDTVEGLMNQHGSDVLRWWVCAQNTDNDVKADEELFKLAGEEYRKVRNTLRFLMMNLADFDPATDRRPIIDADAHTIDAWAYGELAALIRTARDAYDNFRFRKVHEAIYDFCNETLSAVYASSTKDRLYCDAPNSERRRRTQTVMYDTADALIRLLAPVLVHTADEAYLALRGHDMNSDETVHDQSLPERIDYKPADGWAEVMALRDRALKVLEDARAQRGIDNPLDAGVEAQVAADVFAAVRPFAAELADLCGVSRFELHENGAQETIAINDLRDQPRCERSWKRDTTVRPRSDGGLLSDRDARAVGVE